jgi:hypothetical protein
LDIVIICVLIALAVAGVSACSQYPTESPYVWLSIAERNLALRKAPIAWLIELVALIPLQLRPAKEASEDSQFDYKQSLPNEL